MEKVVTGFRRVILPLVVALPGSLTAALGACGGVVSGEPSGAAFADASVIDRARLPAPIVIIVGGDSGARDDGGTDGSAEAGDGASSCTIVIDTPPLVPGGHVAIPSDVTYSSNPPSSGPHYPIWAAYKTFATPVDRRYYVHNLEHGAVVFAYRCTDASGCPQVVAALEAAAASLPTDPLCAAPTRVRAVITPDPLLDVAVAAAAWGWTYKAECVDAASLAAFAQSHYGQGTEQTCSDGQDTF